MKFIQQLYLTFTWWRVGVSLKKAWELASHNIRKNNYHLETLITLTLLSAYAVVAYNDQNLAQQETAKAQYERAKIETAVKDCLNKKAISLDNKSWMKCDVTTLM